MTFVVDLELSPLLFLHTLAETLVVTREGVCEMKRRLTILWTLITVIAKFFATHLGNIFNPERVDIDTYSNFETLRWTPHSFRLLDPICVCLPIIALSMPPYPAHLPCYPRARSFTPALNPAHIPLRHHPPAFFPGYHASFCRTTYVVGDGGMATLIRISTLPDAIECSQQKNDGRSPPPSSEHKMQPAVKVRWWSLVKKNWNALETCISIAPR